MEDINQDKNLNYDYICEFSSIGCEQSGFTREGLKKHNEEFINKHLFLMKNLLEKKSSKTNQDISTIKSNQVQIGEIILNLTQKIEGNENKSNEIFTKFEQVLKKIESFGEEEKKLLGNKSNRDEKMLDIIGYDSNPNHKNKKSKIDEEIINKANNNELMNNFDNNDNNKKNESLNDKNKDKKEQSIMKKYNEEEKINNQEKSKEKQLNKDKKKELVISSQISLQSNKIEIIEEDSDSSINKNTKDTKENINISNHKNNPLKNNTEKKNNYILLRDNHILNNKKIRWEMSLKKITGNIALGISGKKSDEHSTLIIDNENKGNIEEEVLKMKNMDDLVSLPNVQFLLTSEKSTIVWKNGKNYKKTNPNLPLLKEGDNLSLIYCPKFSQLKIQKDGYVFLFENVCNKTKQLLYPSIFLENKTDKVDFHNFSILAEYNKK